MSDNYNINIVHSESDAKTRIEIEGGAPGAGAHASKYCPE